MGQSMARNLALKGFRVTGFDVNPAALEAAAELGIEPAQSAAAAGASAEIAITMLPNSPHEEAAARGIDMIDAPVSGSSVGAVEETLTMMVGGDAAVVERCRPVLMAMGA